MTEITFYIDRKLFHYCYKGASEITKNVAPILEQMPKPEIVSIEMHIENVCRELKKPKKLHLRKTALISPDFIATWDYFPLGYFFILYNTSFCILFVPSSRCSLFLKTNSLHLRGSIFCSTVILKQDVVAWETNCSNWIVYSEIFWQSHGKFVPFDQNLRQAVAFLNILFLL